MNPDWESVSEARVPEADLGCLALLRIRPDIRVRSAEGSAWLSWTTSRADVIRLLMPRPDVQFFHSVNGRRHRLGSLLPTSEAPPTVDERPLSSVLFPFAPSAIPLDSGKNVAVNLCLVRCDSPQPTTALLCELEALRHFADSATTAELARVTGLYSGDRAVLFGEKLPNVPDAVRLHGHEVLLPIGYRLDPDLPAVVVRSAAGIENGEVLLITESGCQSIPRERAEPMTRAGLRLALAGVTA